MSKHKSNEGPPKDLKYPTIAFEDYYHKFEFVKDIIKDPEWDKVFSNFYRFSDEEMDIPCGETVHDLNVFEPKQQYQEIIKCTNNFKYWCHRYVKILHAKYGTIPFIMYNYQERAIDNFENHRFNMISKFRQGGLTTIGALWGLHKCLFRNDQQIYMLSKTDREAVAAGDIVKKAMDNFPEWMYDKEQAEISKHEKKFNDTASKICFYTPEAARGKTATCLMIDEAAFIEKMDEHWEAMYPVVSTGGSVQVISTVNGVGNWYEETYSEALEGNNFFNIIELDYWEHPTYANPEWSKVAKANMGERKWRQEVLRDFLDSGNTYFTSNVIQTIDLFTQKIKPHRTLFEKWQNPNYDKLKWEPGALHIWQEPIEGHEYLLAGDCAEGIGENGDNSCFQLIDINRVEQVAEFYSNNVPPHIFAQIINQIALYYNTCSVVIENNTIGGAVINVLQHEVNYENIYHEPLSNRQSKPGIRMSPQNRKLYLESLAKRLTNGSFVVYSRRFLHELNTFVFDNQKNRAEARKGRHDDAIIAMSIAIYTRDEAIRGMPVGGGVSTTTKDVISSSVFEEIKKEILEDDWEDEDYDFESSLEIDILRPMYGQPHSKILEEFGW